MTKENKSTIFAEKSVFLFLAAMSKKCIAVSNKKIK